MVEGYGVEETVNILLKFSSSRKQSIPVDHVFVIFKTMNRVRSSFVAIRTQMNIPCGICWVSKKLASSLPNTSDSMSSHMSSHCSSPSTVK